MHVEQHVTGGSSAGSDFCSSLCLFGASGCQYKQPRVANSMCASVGCMVRVVHETLNSNKKLIEIQLNLPIQILL